MSSYCGNYTSQHWKEVSKVTRSESYIWALPIRMRYNQPRPFITPHKSGNSFTTSRPRRHHQIKYQHIRQFIISRCGIMFLVSFFPPFFQPTRMLTADSFQAHTSASKREARWSPVSTDVPELTTALQVLNVDMDDEWKLGEMLSSSAWQLMTHLVLFVGYLAQKIFTQKKVAS